MKMFEISDDRFRPEVAEIGQKKFFHTEQPPKCVWQQYGPLETIPDGKKLGGSILLKCFHFVATYDVSF